MIIYVDIDDTICFYDQQYNLDYSKAIPYPDRIKKINELFDKGNDIIYWTQWLTSLLKISIEPTSSLAMAGCFKFLQEVKKQDKNYRPKILVILSGGNCSTNTAKLIWEKDFLIKNPTLF